MGDREMSKPTEGSQYCMVLDGAEILETPVKEANPPVNWLTIHFLIFVIPEPSKHCEPLP